MNFLLLPADFYLKGYRMRLTKYNICHYLLDKGFISFQSVVDGDFAVVQYQGRNLVFHILRTQYPNLFVKQLVDVNPQNIYLLQKEATCYWLFFNEPDFSSLQTYVPSYYGYDVQAQALVVELIPNTANLHDLIFTNTGPIETYPQQMGKILANLHINMKEKIKYQSSLQFFSQQLPWAFNIPFTPATLSFPGQSQQEVVRLIQQNQELCDSLQNVKTEWVISSLIHGDVKLANFIATPIQEPEQPPTVKLIDWEIADIGDPCWDIGGAFNAFLAPWVLSFDNTSHFPPVFLPNMTVFSLERTHTAIQQFWQAYTTEKQWSNEDISSNLLKAVKFLAVRLLQTAIESAFNSPQLMPSSVRLLQMAHHILQSPQQAITTLLALPV